MNWIVAAFLMFVSSVVMYLMVRAATLRSMSVAIQNVAMFLVPLFLYAPLAWSSRVSLQVTPFQFLILVMTAVLFSYLGSKLSVMSLKYAPNPGYSLIISKSYVVFTTLVGVLVFSGELTAKRAAAILLIIGFSALIMIDPKKTRHVRTGSAWLPLSLGALFCWGMLAIMSKYLLDMGVPIYTRLIYVMGIACLLFLRDVWTERQEVVRYGRTEWGLFVGIGALSGVFNYFMQSGYVLAPNIGYINAINAASIAFVTLGAVLIFGDEFSPRKFTGVAGVVGGLVLLVM